MSTHTREKQRRRADKRACAREEIYEVVRHYPGLFPFKDVEHVKAIYFVLDEKHNLGPSETSE